MVFMHFQMKSFSKISLDSCEPSMLNEKGVETLGNVLCKKAQRFAPGQNFQSFIDVSAFVNDEVLKSCFYNRCGKNVAITDWLLPLGLRRQLDGDAQERPPPEDGGGAVLQVREGKIGILQMRRLRLQEGLPQEGGAGGPGERDWQWFG